MLRSAGLTRIHSRFLESCRTLGDPRAYWKQAGRFRRWLLESIFRVPLLSLEDRGRRLYQALQWLETSCKNEPLGEATLVGYHRLLFDGNRDDAGRFRTHAVQALGSRSSFPPPERVPLLVRQLASRAASQEADAGSDPDGVLDFSLLLYQRIGWIHPFSDGNGRVARLAMNHWQRRHGQGYVILPPLSEEPRLLEALAQADRGNFKPLKELSQGCLLAI